jgi:secondary thiamine-phosphate synthase enzyme
MIWIQEEIRLPAFAEGCHPITRQVLEGVGDLSRVRIGLMHVFLQHTSASLTINENADPDVSHDLRRAVDALAPADFPYRHTIEGPDDMPAHVKTSLLGCSLSIPIAEGRLALGTWQGIFLCEHRRRAGSRRLVVTVWGQGAVGD